MRRPPKHLSRRTLSGFSLVEALVASSVAALTLLMLSGASFGLKAALSDPDNARDTDAIAVLTLRRVLGEWLDQTGAHPSSDRFAVLGTPERLRLAIGDRYTGSNAELVVRAIPIGFAVDVGWEQGDPDLNKVIDPALLSTAITSDVRLSWSFLMAAPHTSQLTWHDYFDPSQGLPVAIRLSAGSKSILTIRVPSEIDAICLSAGGARVLDERECQTR